MTVKGTVTARPLAADNCAVIVAVPPFSALLCEVAVKFTVGAASSSVIVNIAVFCAPRTAPTALLRVMTIVSFASSIESFAIATVKVLFLSTHLIEKAGFYE